MSTTSQKSKRVLIDLIENHSVQIFLFGSKSEFNSLCLKIVSELKREYPFTLFPKRKIQKKKVVSERPKAVLKLPINTRLREKKK